MASREEDGGVEGYEEVNKKRGKNNGEEYEI